MLSGKACYGQAETFLSSHSTPRSRIRLSEEAEGRGVLSTPLKFFMHG